ncbi:hypothetical protein BA896_019765 [Janthinobacterium lividum]|uniref:Uncharacterized protein n=1 Tax=Janthinobacterium lividum TaxID=29581 RepID=A0A1E8PM91_9BURK|nr:hypothetical protein BA896_019765 [Janthinobacterium lividum]
MRYWPKTATAVGVRLNDLADIAIAAPFGLHDLFDLVARPTERFLTAKQSVYAGRVRGKNWQGTWPKLRMNSQVLLPAVLWNRTEQAHSLHLMISDAGA